MKKDDKASISLKKVVSISIILLFIMGIVVMAAGSNLSNVKIVLADGYEMDVLTSKTKISEILDENNIILLPTEKVVPALDEEISDNRTIKITVNDCDEKTTTVEYEELSVENILEDYSSITEKIIKEQVSLAYETETKDLSTGSGEKIEKVIQNGVEGLKEISYKVKYENGEELERVQISEEIIQEPVNCIIQITNKPVLVTSRSSNSLIVSGTVSEYQAYAKQRCYDFGWSEYDFECLVKLWNRESGWRVNACNGSSGAYGIPQSVPASKMAAFGSDYLTNYKTQIEWGLSYIRNRYGSPSNAWAHSQSTGWY